MTEKAEAAARIDELREQIRHHVYRYYVPEPPAICPPAAVANAIAATTGARLPSLPITAEQVLRALSREVG